MYPNCRDRGGLRATTTHMDKVSAQTAMDTTAAAAAAASVLQSCICVLDMCQLCDVYCENLNPSLVLCVGVFESAYNS